MRIVQINTTCGIGSTGKICVDISKLLTERNIENYILYSSKTNGYELGISCANAKYIKMQSLKSHLSGNYGFQSAGATHRIIAELERIKPDIVHLHNIHGHDCNLEILFSYFKNQKIKLVWTFHDCWAFTAYCPHFVLAKCEKWKTGCSNCPQFKTYSFFFDKSKELYEKKKALFTGLDLTIVTPSKWLAGLVKESFLKDCDVKVINNGIDLDTFKPTKSDFRQRYGISEDKKMVLGVSFGWGYSKGLDVFIELAERLDKEKYQIVLVGTNENTDKELPQNIISIHRTNNQKELAEIYTAADVFVNPTREDNYPTVNMEAIACGTPVVTFNTGGCAEIINNNSGSVVECDDLQNLLIQINAICNKDSIITDADKMQIDKSLKYNEYISHYKELYSGKRSI